MDVHDVDMHYVGECGVVVDDMYVVMHDVCVHG